MKALRKLCRNEDTRDLPVAMLVVIFMLLFFNAMTTTMAYSFIPEFVKWLGISEVDTGSYAGLVAAAFAIGQTFFSFFWGYLADVKGRKFSLLLSASLLSITTLSFGFSYNLYWAIITRLLQGCSTGIIVISKATISAYCNDANLPFGLSVVSGAYCFGLIMGPSIGGFLAFPSKQYATVFGNAALFKNFPILLPNLVATAGLLISIVLVVYAIPKDGKLQRHVENSYLIDDKDNPSYGALEASDRITDDSFFALSVELDGKGSTSNFQDAETSSRFTVVEPLVKRNRNFRSYFTKENLKNLKILKLFRSKDCMRCCILYGTYSICSVSYRELFPVFAATAAEYNGLNFNSSQIGIVIFVAAVVQILISIFLVSKLSVRFGAIKLFVGCILVVALSMPTTPLPVGIENKHVWWFLIMIIQIVVRASSASCFLCINVLLNNSVEPELLGSANGLGMTLSSLGRAIGPMVFGVAYSWSLTNVKGMKDNKSPMGFPFNQYFCFILISIISVLNGIFIITFPRSLEKKKDLLNDGLTTKELAKTKKITYFTAYIFNAED